MTDDMFGDPGSSSGIKYEDYEGRLLLITPTSAEKDVQTTLGTKDAIRADVVALGEGPHQTEEIPDVLVFPRVLQGQLRAYVGTGKAALGRLGKGVAKPGQNAPWQLATPTDADRQTARAYMTGKSPVATGGPSAMPPF